MAFALDLVSRMRATMVGSTMPSRRRSKVYEFGASEGDVQHQLDGLSRVAAIHARAGRLDKAATLFSSSVHLHEELGMEVPLYQEKRNEETLHILHEQLDDPAFAEAWEHGERLTLAEAVALALES